MRVKRRGEKGRKFKEKGKGTGNRESEEENSG